MDLCVEAEEILNHVRPQLILANTLFKKKQNKKKFKELIWNVNDELETVGEKIIELTNVLSEMVNTLDILKEEGMRVQTSVVVNPKTGKMSSKDSLMKLVKRYDKYKKKLKLYCLRYNILKQQIEAQKIENELKQYGSDPDTSDDDDDSIILNSKPTRMGPHLKKMLEDFTNS